MPVSDLISTEITGIRPFDGLAIDAQIWREAHDHHARHRRLHAALTHRPGIVSGLEVIAHPSRAKTIVVAPGAAIDSNGQTIVQPSSQILTLEERGQVYVVLTYRHYADPESAVSVGGSQEYFRLIEGNVITLARELPQEAHVELARIYRTSDDAAVSDAPKPLNPENNQIDLLNRPLAFPHCFADLRIGELTYVPTSGKIWHPNRAGLWNLLREGNGHGFHLDFSVYTLMRPPAGSPFGLLYMAGGPGFQALTDAEIQALRSFLEEGGTLFGEAVGGTGGFAEAFKDLASKLGAKPVSIKAGDPLLSAHHLFAVPPLGARGDGVLEADADAGILFSSYNYGGAWQGDVPSDDPVGSRDRIRQAQEFGLNVVAFAAGRRRRRELSRL